MHTLLRPLCARSRLNVFFRRSPDRRREMFGIVRGHENGLPIGDDIGHATDGRDDDGHFRRHRLEQYERCPFGSGTQHEQIEGPEVGGASIDLPEKRHAVGDSQGRGLLLEIPEFGAVSDHDGRQRQIPDRGHGSQEYIGALRVVEPTHPPDGESITRKMKRAAGVRAALKRDITHPGIGNEMEPFFGNSALPQALCDGLRDRDDSVEAAKRSRLDPQVESASRPDRRNPVFRGTERRARSPSDARVEQVGPMAVCVEDVGSLRATQGSDEAPLLEHRVSPRLDGLDIDTGVAERFTECAQIDSSGMGGGNSNAMPSASMTCCQPLNHPLETPHRPG
jgi:hypothetical protein